MASDIENIFNNFMADPNFMIGTPEREKKEKAWALAHERYRQTQRNNVALAMAKEDLKKEAVAGAGPDSGFSKYPAKIGDATTIENTKKFGQEQIDLHKDPNRAWRVRPDTAAERTGTKKELEKINPVGAAKKFFGKPKTLEEQMRDKIRRDAGFSKMEKEMLAKDNMKPSTRKGFGNSKKESKRLDQMEAETNRRGGDLTVSKQDKFKAFLEKHLTDTEYDEEVEEPQEENADAEMSTEAEITLDTIIEALTELRENISQHEMDEETGQSADGLEILESIKKIKQLPPHKSKIQLPHSHDSSGKEYSWPHEKFDVDASHKHGTEIAHPHSQEVEKAKDPWGRPLPKKRHYPINPNPDVSMPFDIPPKNIGLPSSDKDSHKQEIQKHYTGPGGKHEHLETGQWVRPGMKIVPSKTTAGNVLAKDNSSLDFKDQDAVKAEAEMLAKKPVKKFDSRGKPSILGDAIQGSSSTVIEKHEDDYMHGHGGDKEKKYPFLSHLIPPAKIKADSAVKKGTNPRQEPLVRNPDGMYVRKPSPNRIWPPAPKIAKDTSSMAEVLDTQKAVNPFAVATAAAKKQGFRDFSENSPGKEKRGEIAEKIKEQEGISKAASINSSGENTQPGFTRNPISNRKVRFALGIRNPRKVLPPDSMTGMGPTTGVTRPQLRVE